MPSRWVKVGTRQRPALGHGHRRRDSRAGEPLDNTIQSLIVTPRRTLQGWTRITNGCVGVASSDCRRSPLPQDSVSLNIDVRRKTEREEELEKRLDRENERRARPSAWNRLRKPRGY